jgi:type I restriction enzyme S subunit
MKWGTVQEINEYVGTSVNPLSTPDKEFELYSVPSYENDYPEIIKGADIGSTKVTVEENDILVCKINPRINRVWIVEPRTKHQLIASSEWVIIRSKSNNPHYLRYYFQSPVFRNYINSELTGIGGSLTRAQPKQIAKYPVPLPPLETQKQIAANLDKVTHTIDLCNAILEKLDLLVKSRFVEMFGDGKYPIVKTSDICDFITKGTTPPTNEIYEDYSEDRIPFLKVYNLSFTGDLLFKQEPQYISKSTHEGKLSRSKVFPNDVLMNIVGPPLGKFSVVTNEYPEWNINQAIAIFRAKEKVIPQYLMSALMQPDVLRPFLEQAVGIRQLNLSLEQCRNLEIPLPPLALQEEFAAFVEQTDKSKLAVKQVLEKAETLKKALMQEYFG